MAIAPDGDARFVVETWVARVLRIPIGVDGAAGDSEICVDQIERLPDGRAFDRVGNLYVSCYEPSRIFRLDRKRDLERLIDHPEEHTLCHPTKLAFPGDDLIASNLDRWHITRIEVGEGLPLPVAS